MNFIYRMHPVQRVLLAIAIILAAIAISWDVAKADTVPCQNLHGTMYCGSDLQRELFNEDCQSRIGAASLLPIPIGLLVHVRCTLYTSEATPAPRGSATVEQLTPQDTAILQMYCDPKNGASAAFIKSWCHK